MGTKGSKFVMEHEARPSFRRLPVIRHRSDEIFLALPCFPFLLVNSFHSYLLLFMLNFISSTCFDVLSAPCQGGDHLETHTGHRALTQVHISFLPSIWMYTFGFLYWVCDSLVFELLFYHSNTPDRIRCTFLVYSGTTSPGLRFRKQVYQTWS